MAKPRIEFLWDKKTDMTQIFVWVGQQLIDKKEMPGVLSSYSKTKVKKEIIKQMEED